MKKYLLPRREKYFKTNLHTHSNISDGKCSPEEVIAAYKGAGYSILCLSDHNVIANHSDKTTEDFLLLTGVEVNINEDGWKETRGYITKTYHLNLIAKDPENTWQPVTFSRSGRETAAVYRPFVEVEEMPRIHSAEAVNNIIARANEKGFFVIYNHPVWSCHSYPEYAPLKGLWGMELTNYSSVVSGYNEHNHMVYQDMLELKQWVVPTGADDSHSERDRFGGWTMIGAEKLTYGSVVEAMEKGDVYMSCGPEILELSLEDNILKFRCSPAASVLMETHARIAKRAVSRNGELLTQGEFDLTRFFERSAGDDRAFVRLTVFGPDGTYAATRAYRLEELKG